MWYSIRVLYSAHDGKVVSSNSVEVVSLTASARLTSLMLQMIDKTKKRMDGISIYLEKWNIFHFAFNPGQEPDLHDVRHQPCDGGAVRQVRRPGDNFYKLIH